MVMPPLKTGVTAVAANNKACAEIQRGKFALSLHAALQALEPVQQPWQSSQPGTPSSEDNNTDQTKKSFQPYHAQSVPRPENLQVHAERNATQVTTLMLRNIPNKYTQNSLLREINEFGFADTYNFFYLPMDVHNRSNVGYAFINFITSEDAERFRALFSDHHFQRFHSRKIGSVCTAHVQGLEENVLHFENRAVTQARNDQYRPIVLKAQKRMDFEEAIAEVKASEQTADLVLGDARSPMPGVAGARQGLEAAIRDLLASSAGSTPAQGPWLTPPAANPVPELSLAAALGHEDNKGTSLPGYGNTVKQLVSLRNVLYDHFAENNDNAAVCGQREFAETGPRLPPTRMDDPVYIPLPSRQCLFSEAFETSSDEWGTSTPRTNDLFLGAQLSYAVLSPESAAERTP